MRILPVIDLLNGEVVHGVAGRRDAYRPLASRWSVTSAAMDVAQSLHRIFGFQRFYLADLDGILHARPNYSIHQAMQAAGFELFIDAGVSDVGQAQCQLQRGAAAVIAGLESLASPDALGELVQSIGAERIIFSLDLQAGVSHVAAKSDWPHQDPLAIAQAAIDRGITQIIVLDLADVGMGTGGSTAALCQGIARRTANIRLITGGGVRGPDDVRSWEQTGVSDLLVASALHDGRLPPEFMQQFL